MADEEQDEFDPGFRIVDKRKGAADEPAQPAGDRAAEGAAPKPEPGGPAEAPPHAEAAEAAGPAPAAPEEEAELEPIDVYAVVQYCISILNGHAWQWMGLVVNPLTKQVERDLAQARVAIDCVEALLKQVEAGLPGPQAKQLRQALADLRVNFVKQSSQAA